MELNYNLDGFSLLDESGAYGAASDNNGGSSLFSDIWNPVKSVLQDGLDVAQDYYNFKATAEGASAQNHSSSFIPATESSMANRNASNQAAATWFNGVSNKTVMIGAGVAAALLLIALKVK